MPASLACQECREMQGPLFKLEPVTIGVGWAVCCTGETHVFHIATGFAAGRNRSADASSCSVADEPALLPDSSRAFISCTAAAVRIC